MLIAGAVEAVVYLGLLDSLNRNASAIQAVTTIVLVVATAWYVVLTRQMVHAVRRSQRPYVYLDLVGRAGSLVEFGVRNYGERAAENVSFEILREPAGLVDYHDKQPLSTNGPLAQGVRYLPPGRGYEFRALAPLNITGGSRGQNVLDVKMTYSYGGLTHQDRSTIDFADLDSILLKSFRDSGEDLAKSVREISSILQRRDAWEQTRRHMPTMQDCPFCNETIRVLAKKCPKCLEWLPDKGPADDTGARPAENA